MHCDMLKIQDGIAIVEKLNSNLTGGVQILLGGCIGVLPKS